MAAPAGGGSGGRKEESAGGGGGGGVEIGCEQSPAGDSCGGGGHAPESEAAIGGGSDEIGKGRRGEDGLAATARFGVLILSFVGGVSRKAARVVGRRRVTEQRAGVGLLFGQPNTHFNPISQNKILEDFINTRFISSNMILPYIKAQI